MAALAAHIFLWSVFGCRLSRTFAPLDHWRVLRILAQTPFTPLLSIDWKVVYILAVIVLKGLLGSVWSSPSVFGSSGWWVDDARLLGFSYLEIICENVQKNTQADESNTIVNRASNRQIWVSAVTNRAIVLISEVATSSVGRLKRGITFRGEKVLFSCRFSFNDYFFMVGAGEVTNFPIYNYTPRSQYFPYIMFRICVRES